MSTSISRIFVCLSLSALALCAADSMERKYFEAAKRFEVREAARPPAWAERTDAPLFRLAWLTDHHITNAESYSINSAAMRAVRELVHPQAFFCTGDHCGMGAGALPKEGSWSLDKRRQRFFRAFLEEQGEGIPFFVVPGDNWPRAFDQVFGPSKYSFTLGGFRFICLGVDAAGFRNGCSLYTAETWEWIEKQLAEHPEEPTLFVQHHPVFPPSFLDAEKQEKLIRRHPQVLGVLSGHLHLDLHFECNGWTQLVGPAVGHGHRPAFKVLDFYRDIILVTTYEWNADKRVFAKVSKYQRIQIPPAYRGKLEEMKEYSPAAEDAMTAEPIAIDTELDQQSEDLKRRVAAAALRFGIYVKF